MKRYRIFHQTIYAFSGSVQLLPHTLRVRPREGHELRIESSRLHIVPAAILRWHRDIEGNSVAVAKFSSRADLLTIESEVVIQQFDLAPLDFVVEDHAVNYPFRYTNEESVLLMPYLGNTNLQEYPAFSQWFRSLWFFGERIQSVALLLRMNHQIFRTISYRRREEEGVQSPEQTLRLGTGSCRDLALLFMASARQLGFAARFVSGYLHSESASCGHGATHAWAEAMIPGAGWKGFDPTIGEIAGPHHIAVAVARIAESVPPVAGKFYGNPGASMKVNVSVTEIV